MNDLSTYFGVNTAVVTPFAYENALNTLITNLDLFDVQYHTENSILLTDLIDQFVQVAGETSPYAQSDWNASKRQEWSNKLFQMKHVGSINAVTSRDPEQYSRQYPNRSDAMLVAVNDFSEAHYRSHANRVEVDLITALLGLKVESEYAGQGDLDFLDGQAKTTVPAIDFASTTVNPFLAIRKAVRLQSEKLGSGLAAKRTGVIIFAAGAAADGLSSNPLISDMVKYAGDASATALFTRMVDSNPAYDSFQIGGITVIDVSMFPEIVAHIGENGFAIVPVMDKAAQCYQLHSGVGVRHAELGQDAVLHHQYLIKDEFQFPSVVTETSYLPVNNIPQAIIFGSAA